MARMTDEQCEDWSEAVGEALDKIPVLAGTAYSIDDAISFLRGIRDDVDTRISALNQDLAEASDG